MADLIDRNSAIDSIEKLLRHGDELYPLTETDRIMNHAFEIAASCVYNLPSAQPDVPDRNVGDMIFRQDAIDATWEKMTYTEQWYVLTEVRKRLKALPSAQPERKKGKWIDAKPRSGRIGKVCSVCGNKAYWDSDYGQQLFDWCPYCGSYNGEETEDED